MTTTTSWTDWTKRDLAISFRDKMCYEKFNRYDQQFPLDFIMTVGVIKGEYELPGELSGRKPFQADSTPGR